MSFDAEGWMSSDELNGLDAPSEFVSAPGDGGGSSTSLVSASMMPRTKTPLEPAASSRNLRRRFSENDDDTET